MRTLHYLIAVFLGIICLSYISQAQYTVKISAYPVTSSRESIDQIPPIDSTTGEWRVNLTARLYNSQGVEQTGSHDYQWYQNIHTLEDDWEAWGSNVQYVQPDAHFVKQIYVYSCSQCPFDSYWIKVVVDDVYESDPVRVPDLGTGYLNSRSKITLNQVRQSAGTNSGIVAYKIGTVYHQLPAGSEVYPTKNSTYKILASQTYYTSPDEKYSDWNSDANVVNAYQSTASSYVTTMQANIRSISNATIKNQYTDGTQVLDLSDGAYFKDPWRISDNSESGVTKNLGMSAPFNNVSGGTNNIGIASNTKGVFLNKTYESGIYYSVQGYSLLFHNQLQLVFDHWEGTNVSFQSYSSLTSPAKFDSSNAVAVARYKVQKPLYPDNVAASSGAVGQHVVVTWTMHPSSNVTEYQIWRKHNGSGGSATLIATVPRSTTTYTDNDMTVTNGYTDLLVEYDVRSHYVYGSINAYSDPWWVPVFARLDFDPRAADDQESGLISNAFKLSAYPNPFNPSTTIPFGLERSSFVRIAIYDLLGREVAVLASGPVSAGTHSVQWGASGVPTGTYICRLTSVDDTGRKMTKSVRLQYVR